MARRNVDEEPDAPITVFSTRRRAGVSGTRVRDRRRSVVYDPMGMTTCSRRAAWHATRSTAARARDGRVTGITIALDVLADTS